ncbi:MAG: glycosyl hydrolase family 18 protein [Chloroflexota bacterium]|jgi:spore germination protein
MNCRFWMLWSFFAFATMLVTIGFLVLRSVTGLSDLGVASIITSVVGERSIPTIVSATPKPTVAATDHNLEERRPDSKVDGADGSGRRVVLGYYVPYDPTSWASFQRHAVDIDFVVAQWVTVDSCGGIGSRDDRTLIAFADERGVKVLPSLLTSSDWLNHRLLTNPAISDRFLNEIVRYVVEMEYPGFDLDLEGIDPDDRDAYSEFVARLADALHKQGKILTLAIPAKASDVRTGWAGPYDYAALGKHADFILLMTYDYSWANGPPGSIAPQRWVDRVASYAVSQIPPSKVLLGLAFYGYDWNTTVGGEAKALLYPQAETLARQYGTEITTDQVTLSATFSYTEKAGDIVPPMPGVPPLQNDIVVRTPEVCPFLPPSKPTGPTATPEPTATPLPTATPVPIAQHVVWLEDARSAAARLEIARRYGVGGVGAWRLGQEDPNVWPHLEAYRAGR